MPYANNKKSSTWWFVERINELEAENTKMRRELRTLRREHRLTAAQLEATRKPRRHLQPQQESA